MVETQVQITDELFQRAKRFAATKEWSFAELPSCGINEFATANEKGFQGFGFERVWNPSA